MTNWTERRDSRSMVSNALSMWCECIRVASSTLSLIKIHIVRLFHRSRDFFSLLQRCLQANEQPFQSRLRPKQSGTMDDWIVTARNSGSRTLTSWEVIWVSIFSPTWELVLLLPMILYPNSAWEWQETRKLRAKLLWQNRHQPLPVSSLQLTLHTSCALQSVVSVPLRVVNFLFSLPRCVWFTLETFIHERFLLLF